MKNATALKNPGLGSYVRDCKVTSRANLGGISTAPTPPFRLADAVQRVAEGLGSLEDDIAGLVGRLTPVISPRPANSDVKAPTPSELGSPIGAELLGLVPHIVRMRDAVLTLQESLEV